MYTYVYIYIYVHNIHIYIHTHTHTHTHTLTHMYTYTYLHNIYPYIIYIYITYIAFAAPVRWRARRPYLAAVASRTRFCGADLTSGWRDLSPLRVLPAPAAMSLRVRVGV